MLPAATYQTGTELSIEGTYNYYVEVTYDGSGCDLARSNDLEVTVDSIPALDNDGDLVDSTGTPLLSQEVCEGGTPETLSVEVISDPSSTGVFSYQWYSNTTNSNTGGIEIDGANSASYTPVSSPVGVTFYYVEVSQVGSGCVVVSNTSQL